MQPTLHTIQDALILLFLIVKRYLTYSFVRKARISCDAAAIIIALLYQQEDDDYAESSTMKLLL